MLTELPQTATLDTAPAYWFINGLNTLLATTDKTGGAYSLVHHKAHPGHATPYHLHHCEDEAFYVLEGEFTFFCDGNKTVLGPGGYIFLPRGLPHGFRCTGSVDSSVLVLAVPGDGFVGMMLEMAVPATVRELPTPTPPDVARLKMLCEQYNIDILGPLPE
jgi:quercetin dioxygenase-like cupin family protein